MVSFGIGLVFVSVPISVKFCGGVMLYGEVCVSVFGYVVWVGVVDGCVYCYVLGCCVLVCV